MSDRYRQGLLSYLLLTESHHLLNQSIILIMVSKALPLLLQKREHKN